MENSSSITLKRKKNILNQSWKMLAHLPLLAGLSLSQSTYPTTTKISNKERHECSKQQYSASEIVRDDGSYGSRIQPLKQNR